MDGQDLFYDNQETVRFRIEEEHWHDQTPVGPSEKEDGAAVKQSPYTLTATMEDAGLGPCLWWDGEEE
jgi:DNA-directed RNA polymerase III subunit RPC8